MKNRDYGLKYKNKMFFLLLPAEKTGFGVSARERADGLAKEYENKELEVRRLTNEQ